MIFVFSSGSVGYEAKIVHEGGETSKVLSLSPAIWSQKANTSIGPRWLSVPNTMLLPRVGVCRCVCVCVCQNKSPYWSKNPTAVAICNNTAASTSFGMELWYLLYILRISLVFILISYLKPQCYSLKNALQAFILVGEDCDLHVIGLSKRQYHPGRAR